MKKPCVEWARFVRPVIVSFFLLLVSWSVSHAQTNTVPSMAAVQSAYGHLPLSFEANEGQVDSHVQFLTRGRGHTLFLRASDAVLALRNVAGKTERRNGEYLHYIPDSSSPTSDSVVRMTFDGANPQAEVVGLDQLPGIVNYFIGGDPSKWRTNIPTYQKVEYKNVYAGIDLVYYGNQGQLEYDLIVAPGADPTQITLSFDGAEQIEVDQRGDLVLTVPQSSNDAVSGGASTLRLHKPVVYQRDDQEEKHFLAATYVLLAPEAAPPRPSSAGLHPSETPDSSTLPNVAFQIAAYDSSRPLIIDPVLAWSTYLGGSGLEEGRGIAVDPAGNAYVTGLTSTLGSGFPGTAGSQIQSALGSGGDAFVTKLNAAGTALVYSTYLGGSDFDQGFGIAVDAAGNAYVTGLTKTPGSGFPGTAGSQIQSTFGGIDNAFVTKLNAAGTALVYSTYLGGSGAEGQGIAVDQAGNAYVTGVTSTPGSGGFSGTAGSQIQSTLGGALDAFVTKVNATGTALVYSTYLGGSGDDQGFGIAVDLAGNAYVTGLTGTPGSGFPGTAGSLVQSTYGGGGDAFVTKVNAAGTALVYSTYLGSSVGDDIGFGIAVDQVGNAYVTGFTSSPGSSFPGTASSLIQHTFGGVSDAFVAKITNNASPSCSAAQATPTLLWSPNHQFVPVAVTGVTDADGRAVAITVSSVTQDEPVNAKGDGNTSPDAVIQAGSVSVRAERSGNGNGRVYRISFKADDGQGGFCTGVVTVGVPHSLNKGTTAIDDGQVYDSTIP